MQVVKGRDDTVRATKEVRERREGVRGGDENLAHMTAAVRD